MEKKFNTNGYEVLIYISDQHTATCMGCMGDEIAETPNLDKIAKSSFQFNNAYTSCPLCVPARASFLTGKLPSNIGVFNNASDYCSSEITFAHAHALKGYETTLIGRMHFVGMDFYHGFTNRIGKDLTASYWGCASEKRKDLGDFGRSLYQKYCLEVIGSGDSPVLSYDREIVGLAKNYLKNDYEKNQLIVVGTYSPHFPYVCDENLMKKYRQKIQKSYVSDSQSYSIPPIQAKMQKASQEDIIELRSAYYSMIEIMDRQIGEVYGEYQEYLKRNNKKGIFIYMSDHGDQIGYKDIYGKQTFFEKSAKIPLIINVTDFEGGEIDDTVSIMDIAETLCEINQTEPIPEAEGKSFANLMLGAKDSSRYAIAEYYDTINQEVVIGNMVHKNDYKLISYDNCQEDLLYNTKQDALEKNNLAINENLVYNNLKDILHNDSRIINHKLDYLSKIKKYNFLEKVGENQKQWNEYMYEVPENVRTIESKYKRQRRGE